jgi:hypothetical protein
MKFCWDQERFFFKLDPMYTLHISVIDYKKSGQSQNFVYLINKNNGDFRKTEVGQSLWDS